MTRATEKQRLRYLRWKERNPGVAEERTKEWRKRTGYSTKYYQANRERLNAQRNERRRREREQLPLGQHAQHILTYLEGLSPSERKAAVCELHGTSFFDGLCYGSPDLESLVSEVLGE